MELNFEAKDPLPPGLCVNIESFQGLLNIPFSYQRETIVVSFWWDSICNLFQIKRMQCVSLIFNDCNIRWKHHIWSINFDMSIWFRWEVKVKVKGELTKLVLANIFIVKFKVQLYKIILHV